jgi:hypothetical protein
MALPAPYTSYESSTDVRIPAGVPPVRLKTIKSKDEAKPNLEDWCHNIRIHFLNKGQWMSCEALCYFIQYEFNMESKKYEAACKIINRQPDILRT